MKYSKLLETILRFRGSNPATVKDVVDMRQFMNANMRLRSTDRAQGIVL